MSKVKVGDKVKSLVTQFDVVVGETYPVIEVSAEGGVCVKDNAGDSFYLMSREWEAIPEQTPFKVGDRVRVGEVRSDYTAYVPELAELNGQFGTVAIADGGDDDARVVMDGGRDWYLPLGALELVTDEQPEQQDIYLVSGYASEFPTQEAAEDYVKSIGSNGEEYRIAKLVRTVKVSRVTTISLEAV